MRGVVGVVVCARTFGKVTEHTGRRSSGWNSARACRKGSTTGAALTVHLPMSCWPGEPVRDGARQHSFGYETLECEGRR